MKYFYFLSAIMFIACGERQEKQKPKKVDSAEIFGNLLNYHEDSREIFLQKLPPNMISSLDTSSSFRAKCIAEPTDEIPKTSIQEKDTNNPFDTLIKRTTDSVYFSFKVSNECCLEYFGGYTISNDSILINFCSTSFGCDCYCDYRLEYLIPVKDFRDKFRIIKVHD